MEFYNWQLQWIAYLQSFSNPALDAFFKFLNFFDTFYFYMFLIPIIWIAYNQRWGVRLYFLVISVLFFITTAKQIFAMPRPFFLVPEMAKIVVGGYGFPSGAAVSAVVLGCILIYTWKNTISWIIGINYIFWVSLSRMYLGVHFPIDILGGWCLGFLIVYLFFKSYPKIEKFVLSLPKASACLLSQLLGILLYFLLDDHKDIYVTASTMSLGAGLYYQAKYNQYLTAVKTKLEGFYRSLFVILGCIIIYCSILWFFQFFAFSFKKQITIFVQLYLLGLWISFFVPCLLRKIAYNKV